MCESLLNLRVMRVAYCYVLSENNTNFTQYELEYKETLEITENTPNSDIVHRLLNFLDKMKIF